MSTCCLNELLIRYSAPTLAGIKTGNLFAVTKRLDKNLKKSIAQFNFQANQKNIRLIPIKCQANRTLLYIYRPKFLEQDFRCKTCKYFLGNLGYPVEKASACLREYISRLSKSHEFLHEIGFFLGYPAEDVIGFIKRGPKEAKCNATWLVYSDVTRAQHTAKTYKTCSKIYYTNWQKGRSIESLTVPI
ncbi:MAG: DUF3793 family protein [Bacteroidales bacterium]|nr:DUF3793 family protein [Bacteroidales bacterium]